MQEQCNTSLIKLVFSLLPCLSVDLQIIKGVSFMANVDFILSKKFNSADLTLFATRLLCLTVINRKPFD